MSQIPALIAVPPTPSGFANLGHILLAAAAASITVSGFATTYREFSVIWWTRPVTDSTRVMIRLNNDSGANYDQQGMEGDGATITNNSATGLTAIEASLNTATDDALPSMGSTMVYKNAAAMAAVSHTLVTYQATVPLLRNGQLASRWGNTADLISTLALLMSSGNLAANSMVSVSGLIP